MAKKEEKEQKKKGKNVAEEKPVISPLQAQFNVMSGTEKAAVIMLLLGEQQAADVIRFMAPREVNALGSAMVSVADLSQDLVNLVLDDFVSTLKTQTNLGLGTPNYVQNVFKRALGDEKAATVLGKIMPPASSKGLEILQWMDAKSIGEMINEEHPQVIAIILSVLEHDIAAEVLEYVSEAKRSEIIKRVASLDSVQPSAMAELEGIMAKQFTNNTSSKASSIGGVETAAKIMNFAKVDVESGVMSGVTKMDKELATQIQDRMLTFENMADIDNRSMQRLLRDVENDLLLSGLRGADEATKDKFLSNMSERARDLLLDDMEAKGPIRVSEVEAAQKAIMQIARKLSDDGEIMLAGAGEAFV
ncbi:MAG: flagellar motor switch protein FliG [Porticoccaceae bacterium]|nr:flagellar motor switch protein FliG [Porticoccaceae bacterium]|tara:strand:- start:787 stop:1869 length:1083 start_codon:yes stop_codon:yes gene_type:complete